MDRYIKTSYGVCTEKNTEEPRFASANFDLNSLSNDPRVAVVTTRGSSSSFDEMSQERAAMLNRLWTRGYTVVTSTTTSFEATFGHTIILIDSLTKR